jgi:hypothetical protein
MIDFTRLWIVTNEQSSKEVYRQTPFGANQDLTDSSRRGFFIAVYGAAPFAE